MTDAYINGFKITLVTLRGGSRVIVIRDSMNLRYIRHFTELEDFNKWLVIKEYDHAKAECNQED